MPQIQVNEIDQSVVTRVVSDDKVKILVPVIASFGPGYDGTLTSINTFTDVTDFNKVYGYTDAEFNPFQDDYSRIYATQLIEKGGAVSVVRVNNNGLGATFNIEGVTTDRTGASITTICPAVAATINPSEDSIKLAADNTLECPATKGGDEDGHWSNTPTTYSYSIIPGTFCITDASGNKYTDSPNSSDSYATGNIVDSTNVQKGVITYANGQFTITDTALQGTTVTVTFNYISTLNGYEKYTFCPQIDSITAKYTGSFGNNLAVAITQVNTTRVSESYQYANISVYYVQKKNVYSTDQNGGTIIRSVITNTTLLESKRVSTNPNDAYYFEDVEFDFIKINATPTAKSELALVWGNINSATGSGVKYSGFPAIPLRYINGSDLTVYNTNAILDGGTDFAYSEGVLAKLKQGFMGYYPNTTGTSITGSWTAEDVDDYLDDVYGDRETTGIIPTMYTSIANLYQDFTDPYIYDFDFITSGGFVYQEYTVNRLNTKTATQTATLSAESTTNVTLTIPNGELSDTVKIVGGTVIVTVGNTSYVDVPGEGTTGTFKQVNSAAVWTSATINYSTGVVTLPVDSAASTANISFNYKDTTVLNQVSVTYPATSDGTSVYTEITPIHTAMLNLVNTRQDCIALFDVPANYDTQAIVEYSRMLNTSYGTMHHPWCWVQSPTIAGKNILMAPSYIFLYTFLSNLINNVESQKWFPPAGVKRATARVVKKPDYEIGSVILNAWQNDNTSRVNPIMKLKQYGYVIYGQYTTLEAIDTYTHSALESLNVRLISNVVKKKIFDTCLNLAFEPNTSALWLKFFAQMDEFLRYMQYNEGVYDYRIVMDESTVTTDDINQLRCPGKVYIAPTRTAEFFDIDFIITEAGAIFTQD